MKLGDEVVHAEYGKGTIKRILPEGPTARVDFGYMEDLVPTANLKLVKKDIANNDINSQPSSNPKNPKTDPSPVKPTVIAPPLGGLSKGVANARRAIVALRLGQVLESHVAELSVGLEKALEQIGKALDQAQKQKATFVMVEGAWGGGKTHILTLLTGTAAKRGFACSSIVLDGVGVTLSEPKQLMVSIIGSLRFPGDILPGGIANHLASAKRQDTIELLNQQGSRILHTALIKLPQAVFADPDAVHIIEDYMSLCLPASRATSQLMQLGYCRIALPALLSQGGFMRFGDLLSDWAQLCVAFGFRGLVVVLDELDVEYAKTIRGSQQSTIRRNRRSHLLEVMRSLRKDRVPLVLAFASAPAGGGVDPENDAAYNIPQMLGGIDESIQAPIPSEEDIKNLCGKVIKLYGQAYPDSFPDMENYRVKSIANLLVEWYGSQMNPVPRYLVRSVLEVLDITSQIPS